MTPRRFGILLALALMPATVVFAENVAERSQIETISVDRAIELALAQNRELSTAAAGLGVSRGELDAVKSAFDLQIRPVATLQSIGTTQLKNFGLSVSKELPTGTQLRLSGTRGDTLLPNGVVTAQPAFDVSLEQPLFREFGTTVTQEPIRAAESQLLSARRQYGLLREQVVGEVVDAFLGLYQLQEQIKLDELTIHYATELERATRAYEIVGRAKRLDSLRARFQLDQATARLGGDKQRLATDQSAFAELLGLEPDARYVVQQAGWPRFEVDDPKHLLALALANRLDYAQALQDYRDAKRGEEVARKQLLPQISVSAGYRSYSASPLPGGSLAAGGGAYFGLSGGVGANRSAARAAVSAADSLRDSRLENVRLVSARVAREIEAGRLAYESCAANAKLAARASEDAAARATLARELYHLGRADSFAVGDADEALVVAQQAFLTSNTEVARASYKLARSVGELVAADADLKPEAGGLP